MIKPLARWTIGNCNDTGIEMLTESIKSFTRIYPEFDCVLCFNNLNESQISIISEIDIKQIDQHQLNEFNLTKTEFVGDRNGSGWKLVPSRLNPLGHELWIDNDIVINRRIPIIDEWLNVNNYNIISQGIYRIFDVFTPEIDQSLTLCAGFFGLAPNMDIGSFIEDQYHKYNKSLGGFYEQGLVVKYVTMHPFFTVSLGWLSNAEHYLEPTAAGYHFVGANRNNNLIWEQYKKKFFIDRTLY